MRPALICLLPVRAYHGAYRSYCMLCLHVCEACRSSLSPTPTILVSISQFLTFPLMSHNHSSSTSSDFQPIFDNAMKTYKKCTKKDLLKHPLADRLRACDSPSSILTVLQEQVQELNESQRSTERLTKWLDPTVSVLHAFSETLGGVVSLVSLRT
jgi:hypothetical protein